jgi:hypothetical protein
MSKPRHPFPLLFSPHLRASASPHPVLLDTFTGSGALTDHTPEICPAGASWSIKAGAWGNLSSGILPYVSGTYGKAVIDCGLSDCEIRFRLRVLNYAANSEVIFRASSSAGEFYKIGVQKDGLGGVQVFHNVIGWVTGTVKTVPGAVPGDWLTFHAILKGRHFAMYDESGELYFVSVNAGYLSNTYVGCAVEQPYGSWDFIEVKPLYHKWRSFSVMGDSISNETSEWPGLVAGAMNYGRMYLCNHAVSGSSIASNMDGQTTQCVADNADFTIIALGTNDGTITDITPEYQENLLELWNALHKPIYCCGIFPRVGSPEARILNNTRIAAAVANAVAAGANVTYWDTDGWIDPTAGVDTSDGLHPNGSGQAKIKTEILSRLP